MKSTIIEIIEVAIGPILFTVGIICATLMLQCNENLLTAVKKEYASDAVYSQKYIDTKYKDTVSSDDLIGTLLASPTVEMQITNKHGWRKIDAQPLSDGSLRITVTEKQGDADAEVFNKTLFNLQGFDRNYIESGEYNTEHKYDSSGALKMIKYVRVE